MAGESKGKAKAEGPVRRHPECDKIEASAKIQELSASPRSTPSTRSSRTPSKTPSATASPALQAANSTNHGDRGTSTPSSGTSQAAEDFYAHMEAASSESSRWDTDSVLGAVLEDLTDETGTPRGRDTCTPDEAVHLRHMLRQLGPQDFCRVTVDEGRYTAKKLLTAFGVRPPPFLEGSPDEAYFTIVSAAIERELSKRAKLPQYNTVADAVSLIQRSKNIIVLTGAGISTSLGIPDFRSKGTGLYSKLEESGLVSQPEDVFEIHQFREDPSIFYSVAKDIIAPLDRCTPTHAFIALLQEKGKLLTNYTQNIDNLEAVAGVRPEKLIQCHGSFATATCIKCGYQTNMEEIMEDARAGIPPPCPECLRVIGAAQGSKKRKRKNGRDKERKRGSASRDGYDSDSEGDDDVVPVPGIMKPDITFYGEEVPDAFATRLTEHDRDLVDLVIVIGTSLTVQPVSEIVRYLPPSVPQINISKTPIDHLNFDVDLLGPCDVVVAELARRLGWKLEHEMIPKGQVVNVDRVPGFVSRHVFTEVEPAEGLVKKG